MYFCKMNTNPSKYDEARRAAIEGHDPMAYLRLGIIYFYGTHTERNVKLARYFIGKAITMCSGKPEMTALIRKHLQAECNKGDYGLLYDHQRQGLMLTEGVGYWLMSNRSNLLNFYVSFEVTQCWSRSTRDHVIDKYLGLNGKDMNRYFDLIYSIKLCWMFPLTGKPSQEYYYY